MSHEVICYLKLLPEVISFRDVKQSLHTEERDGERFYTVNFYLGWSIQYRFVGNAYLSNGSIAKVAFHHDFFSAPESGDNATHEGAAAFRLHIYQSSSGVALHCQREKPKTLYTTIDNHYGVWCLLRSAPWELLDPTSQITRGGPNLTTGPDIKAVANSL